MGQDHVLWVHGNSAEIEYPDLAQVVRKGSSIRVLGAQASNNWLHFAMPTPVILDNLRMKPVWLQFRYKTTGGVSIHRVDVYDGEKKISSYENTNDPVDGDWFHFSEFMDIGRNQSANLGIGVSIGLAFHHANAQIDFESAGCTFEAATRIASQRLPIYTGKAPMELPYRSSLPIDHPGLRGHNGSIERIVVSLHGSGGNADSALADGLAAVQAAVNLNVDPAAADNTLVIAPQFINPVEHYREIPPRTFCTGAAGAPRAGICRRRPRRRWCTG